MLELSLKDGPAEGMCGLGVLSKRSVPLFSSMLVVIVVRLFACLCIGGMLVSVVSAAFARFRLPLAYFGPILMCAHHVSAVVPGTAWDFCYESCTLRLILHTPSW